ncbi:MAG TPA: LamG-like jellyroll fold domain-containing protein, partial [Burkholderiales bacterium]|nr:LamG-like jellyroll fold domain-containing protein [Burkholderiales bacterium]
MTRYLVERCQGAGCSNFVQVGTPNDVSFGDAGLLAATTYRYRVRAADWAGNLSGYSNVASATTLNTPPTGLVAAYGFNEGTGTAVADASGRGNTGTINGAAWTAEGRFGAALSFNGTDNVVLVPSSTSLNLSSAMTLEAWVRPTANQADWRAIIQKDVDAYYLYASGDDPL